MTSVREKDELEDFEAFLEPDFRAPQFANDIILATNDHDDSQLDLMTPIKKLKFDINECEKRMKSISTDNHESLISHFSKIEDTRSAFNDSINPSLERVNNSFQRVKDNVIKPYDEAVNMNNAMRKIHATLNLVRGSGYFIFLLQQLEDSEKAYGSADVDNVNDNKEVIRLARLNKQLSQFYASEKDVNKHNALNGGNAGNDLFSIKFIRDYQSIHLNKTTSLVNDLNQFIVQDFNHHTSFSVSNIKLQNNLIALYLLNEKEVYQIVEKSCINKHVQTSLTQLTRSLQSPRNFTTVVKETKASSDEYIKTLEEILKSSNLTNISSTAQSQVDHANNTEEFQNLLDVLNNHFEGKSISKVYWANLSHKFKKNIVATMARGGPIAKNLKVYQSGIKSTIEETFDGEERDLFVEAIDLINTDK